MPNELLPMDKVKEILPKLDALIKKLPTTLPCGSKNSPLAKYFTALSVTMTALMKHSISHENVYFNVQMLKRSFLLCKGNMD